MRTYVLYHGNCFDGMCSAWILSKVYPDATFIPMTYDMKALDVVQKHDITGEHRVVMVDFSFKREEMIWLNGVGELLVLDHHKTAEKELEGLPFAKFDMNESGASLAWKYYFPEEPIPSLVKFIADRDLWKFELDNSDKINSYIQSYPMTLEDYDMLYKELELAEGYWHAVAVGEGINRYKKTMVETMCKNAQLRNIGGYLVPVVNASMLFSEVGEWLCNNFIMPTGELPNFGAYYFDRVVDGIRQWGMRSRNEFDVSLVAKMYGGGGHKNAAGFQENINGSILRNSEVEESLLK